MTLVFPPMAMSFPFAGETNRLIEKLDAEVESTVELTEVLAVGGETLKVGTPVVEGAKVVAKVLAQGKAKKVTVFKYKRKKDYRRKNGHRQPYTKLVVEKIEA